MIYILEDNPEIRELELYTLKNAGYEVEGFAEGSPFLSAIEKRLPELVILDIMLPDISGLDVLKRMRQKPESADIPVIMLTAKTTEADRVRGFDYGAGDYISKPFSLIEFLARVRAVLKRSGKVESGGEVLRFGALELDRQRRTVRVDGESRELTYKEFELLLLLVSAPERVFTRDMLMDRVWGVRYMGESRTVDAHIKTLRQKLGNSGELIKTVRNVGYKIGL